jgi:hypothetical protein
MGLSIFTVNDQAQRNEALDMSQSFIVQAPAGSGKTQNKVLKKHNDTHLLVFLSVQYHP